MTAITANPSESSAQKRLARRIARRRARIERRADGPGAADVADLIETSAGTYRAAAGRMIDRPLSGRLRRMANRRMSWVKALERTEADRTALLVRDGAPIHGSLDSCLAHDRAVLMLINEILADGPVPGRDLRLLRRIRDQLERDGARLRGLIAAAPGGGSSEPGHPAPTSDTPHQ